jgi:ATP-dependent RNA helicase DDX31/DBP7
MENYVTVGFDQATPSAEESLIATIPKQIQQFYAEIPT